MNHRHVIPKCSEGSAFACAITNAGFARSVSRSYAGVVLCATSFALVAFGAPQDSEKCSNLKSTFSMTGATITSAQIVSSGSFSPVDPGAGATPVTGLPDFCRVVATLMPTSDSQIGMEVWMPVEGWNGKFQSVGNHNLGGVIYYGDMGLELKRNYAVASSDTGHIGNDAKWGAGHPEKLADFGWRAVHQSTVTAKAVVAAFYGAAPRYSYFNGCSMGGREALQEAQRFPDDYDGIVSGSAMNNWTRSHMAHIFASQVLLQDGADAAHYIPPAKNELILNSSARAVQSDRHPGGNRWFPAQSFTLRLETAEPGVQSGTGSEHVHHRGPGRVAGEALQPRSATRARRRRFIPLRQ